MKATPEDVAKRRPIRYRGGVKRPERASMKATPEDVAKSPEMVPALAVMMASMKATPEDVAKTCRVLHGT